jgi:hypothetical protein
LQDLKKHPFFENVQWEGLRNTPSPIKKALNPLKTEEKETDYYKEQSRKPKVLKSGLVRKLKSFFLYNTRQFILFDNASIDYLDPENGELKV